jgi:uncharacterized lipoprotein YmbA
MKKVILIVILAILLTGCGKAPIVVNEAQPPVTTTESSSTPDLVPETQASVQPSLTITVTQTTDWWKSLPIVPEGVSRRMVEIYQNGLARGRDQGRFSKFGDCQNIPTYFLYSFDTGDYRLGEKYSYLQPTIDHFNGSWERASLAVKGGMNVSAVQTLLFTNVKECGKNETPMACEIRKYNPSIVIISFEETWAANKLASKYENRLSSVVEYVLSQDVVPILATKADNVEGDYSINAAIAAVASRYEVPLWNFWAATNPLPNHGIAPDDPDHFHLTFAKDYFDDPVRMENAWPWRNLTALQSIDAVYRALNDLK